MKRYKDFIKITEKDESTYIISIYELEKIIKNIFDDTKVSSVNTTYEKIDDGYKFIITINNLFYGETNILHTKFVFYIDDNKDKLIGNYFHYLYDINCKFKKIKFDDGVELEDKLNLILNNRNFGDDIKDLSDISVNLVSVVNSWLVDNGVDGISLYNINYNPLVDAIPCEYMVFNFNINIEDIRNIKVVLRKIDKLEYKLTFSENDWFHSVVIDDIKSIPQTIGNVVKNYII